MREAVEVLALPLVKTSADGVNLTGTFLYLLVLATLLFYGALTLWAAFG